MSAGIPASLAPDTVYRQLRARIIGQEQAPGSTLTESAVSLSFGVARPTAKLAIERLVSDGLLRREAHRAARVPQLGRDDVVDLFDSRAVIESAAIAALATHGTLPDDALAAHSRLMDMVSKGAGYADDDILFHRALVTGQPSVRLARMHGMLMGEIELCIGQVESQNLREPGEVASQHQGILDAILRRDAAGAAARTLEHIHESRDRLLARYDLDHPVGS